jgi:CHAT domain-containing protein
MAVLPQDLSNRLSELDLRTAEEIAEKQPDLYGREMVIHIANEANRIAREDLSRGEHLAGLASKLSDALDDDFCRARAARSAANMKVLRGRNEDALVDLSKALALFRELGVEGEVAATLSSSLQPLIYQGRYEEALERGDEARAIAARIGDQLLLARIEVNSGNILHRQDRFLDAVKRYEVGLQILRTLEQNRDCAIALVNLAVCFISLHEFRSAEQAYTEARESAVRENMPTIVAQADYNIAYLHFYRGEYQKAFELYQKTRAYCEEVGDTYHRALCDLDQSEMYLELHLHQEGRQLAQQALEAFERMQMSYEATKALVFLGIAAYQNHQLLHSLELFSAAQARMESESNLPWVAALHLYQALILKKEGRYHEALRSCGIARHVLGAHPTFLLAETHLLTAELYLELEQPIESENWIETALDSAQWTHSSLQMSRAYYLSGYITAWDQPAHAHVLFDQALANLESNATALQIGDMKIPSSANYAEIYEALVDLQMNQNAPPDVNRTFEVMEKARSMELAELLRFRLNPLPTRPRKRSALVERVNNQREELNWYYRKAYESDVRTSGGDAKLQSSIREQEKSLAKSLAELKNSDRELHSLLSAEIIPRTQVQSCLSSDELIVEFFIAAGFVYACLLQSHHLKIVPIACLGTVQQQMREMRTEFRDAHSRHSIHYSEAHLTQTLKTLQKLYATLIAPVEDQLQDKRLCIVPDGPLRYLPFQALFDGDRFFFEKYVLSYADSASMHWLASSKPSCSSETDYFIGEYGRESSAQAPTPRFSAVSSLRDFAEQTKDSRFIHLNCSLQLRGDNVLFSKLQVGHDTLSIVDLFHFRLPCEVLSISGTGVGVNAYEQGREVLGLSQGFQYAGARSVVIPLWNPDSFSTDIFLAAFYERATIDSDTAIAFQKAMAASKDRNAHPLNWAAFTLRGKVARSEPSAGDLGESDQFASDT